MKKKGYIIGVNLLILIAYSSPYLFNQEHLDEVVYFFGLAVHSTILLITTIAFFFMRKTEMVQAFLLSGLLILLIGASFCSQAFEL